MSNVHLLLLDDDECHLILKALAFRADEHAGLDPSAAMAYDAVYNHVANAEVFPIPERT